MSNKYQYAIITSVFENGLSFNQAIRKTTYERTKSQYTNYANIYPQYSISFVSASSVSEAEKKCRMNESTLDRFGSHSLSKLENGCFVIRQNDGERIRLYYFGLLEFDKALKMWNTIISKSFQTESH